MSSGSGGVSAMSNPRYMPPEPSNTTRTPNPHTNTDKTYNGTGYYLENDEADTNFTDLQTLFLACFATLVPLVLSLVTAFVVRCLWRRYRRNKECQTYDGVMHQEGSADHVSGQSGPLHLHLLMSDQMNICESSLAEGGEENSGSPVMYSGSSSRTNHASANGSIITMTLKNNHLIVETEERNDIIEDSRETTMKYSPSAQDGVFVVEVQQGVRREQPYSSPEESLSDQKALVHNPPERFNDADPIENLPNDETSKANKPTKSVSTYTGLSQSTNSLSSNSPNPSYKYGNQQGYDNGHYGYPVYNGYINDEIIIKPLDNKPKITSAVYKENGRLMHGYSIDATQPILMSDIQDARKYEDRTSLGNSVSSRENSISQQGQTNGYEVS